MRHVDFKEECYSLPATSDYFHIPLDVYSCGFKCNTFLLFTSALIQSVCFSRKCQAVLLFAAFMANDDTSALLTLVKSERLLA